MARTRYADSQPRPARRPGAMPRDEYLARARELAPRGQALPQSRLSDEDVADIRSAARQREALRKHIRDNLSNEALAKRLGVHVRTVEKVLSLETWGHVMASSRDG